MYKIIHILLFGCIFTANAHFNVPLPSNKNSNILINKNETKVSYILPKTAIPKKYTLTITPYLDENSDKKFTFDGIVEIQLDVIKSVQAIVLHSKNLQFNRNDIKLKKQNTEIQEFSVKFAANKDFVNITSLSGLFQEGSYTLTISYVGVLNDELRGFYRSSYVNAKGTKTWLATTHFEPVSARSAFPCFDEPEYKATFDLTIIHDKKYTAVSNTKAKSTTATSVSNVATNFYTTPTMSTYLLAFVVSDFSNVTNFNKNFSIFARPNAIQHCNLALEVGQRLLKELEKFTGIPFLIKKMDQAAIPDFAAGAMENWGLVLYREKSLLFDDKVLTTSDKQNIIETISHEFAHQWFGNLLSPKWWKYTWLNEGFANFFQSYITEKVEPEWQSIYQAVIKDTQTKAFDFDSGSTTHPLNHDVESPNEISAIFDSISYQKGGAVLRMMQHFLTESVFQKSLQNYLNKNSLTAVNSNNLLDSIQEIINKEKLKLDLKTIMDKWINYKGYPAVYVTRNYNNPTVEIRQERFFKYNASEEERANKYEWYIPINYASEDKPDFSKTVPQEWLNRDSMNISVNIKNDHWLIFNKQQTGYYRVNYDERNWQLIINYLKSKNRNNIHVLNRAQLINDALAFTQQEKLSLETLLHLTATLKNETDYITWYPGFKTFSWLKSRLINTEYYSTFKDYVLSTTKILLESVGLEENQNDKHVTKLNRIEAIDWSCLLGHKSCMTNMNEKLVAWLNNSTKNVISPDLKKLVLCHGLKSADLETWHKVLDKSIETKDSAERKQFLTALGCSNNKDNLKAYFNYIVMDNSPFNDTSKDISTAIDSALTNSDVGVDSVLEFTIKRFITLLRKIKNEDDLTKIFSNIGDKITTAAQLEQLKSTQNMDIPLSITGRGIELAEKNINWLQSNDKTLRSWTKDYNSNSKSNGVITSGYLSLVSLLVIVTHFIIN